MPEQERRAGMPMDWNTAIVVAACALVYVGRAHWQASGRAWPARALRLGDARRAFVEWLRLHTAVHLEGLAGTLRVARADHDAAHTDRALDVLDLADRHAAFYVRWLRTWLQRWADLAHLFGLAPAPPPMPPVRLAPLHGLRTLEHLGDALLPPRGRFHLGVRLQRLALQWLGWNAGAARWRARRTGRLAQALDELEATHADLVALDRQALTTLERLLHVLPGDARAERTTPAAAARPQA